MTYYSDLNDAQRDDVEEVAAAMAKDQIIDGAKAGCAKPQIGDHTQWHNGPFTGHQLAIYLGMVTDFVR